jgi:hypothetical protein
MDDSDRRHAKRSRFDQTEPEPRRPSRFDRRSRSPPPRKLDSGRDRSPLSKGRDSATPDAKSPIDPAAAAGTFRSLHVTGIATNVLASLLTCPPTAAAAAKINAGLQARKGIQQVDVPPVKTSTPDETHADKINGEMYIADGDYIKDIEVNDLRNRYLLTKGATQKMVNNPWLFY